MYIPSGFNIAKLFYKYPFYMGHILDKKNRFYRRYKWAEKNSNRDGQVPPPLAFKLYLTLKCNLSCKMCMFWGDVGVCRKNGNPTFKEELDWKVLKNIFRQSGSRRPSFILSGGEPLLYSRFKDLAMLIKKHRCFAYVCTNGILVDKFIDTISDNPYLIFYISVDGPKEINDLLRGQGVYEKVTNNIRLAKALKSPPYLGVQFTLQPDNVGVIYNTCKEMVKLGVDWILINLRWYINETQSRKYEETMRKEFGVEPKSHLGFVAPYNINKKEFLNQVKKIKEDKWPIQISCYLKDPEDICSYIDFPEKFLQNKFCYKQWVRMDVLPNSDITSCIQYPDLVLGNLKNKNIMEIWNSCDFERFRQFIRQKTFSVCSKCYALYLYDAKRKYL